MTDTERDGWKRAMQDYESAYKIARKVWPESTPPEVIQSATATLLIHHKAVAGVGSAPKQAVVSGQAPAPAAPGIPSCPKCGGAMKDVRAEKRSDKSPDFQCLQQKGQCGKTDAAKGKFYPTGKWATPLPPKANPVRAAAEQAFGPLDDVPEPLQDDDDQLPF